MALKPGQIKDLKVELKKLHELEALEKKIEKLWATRRNLEVDKSLVGPLAKEFKALAEKVRAQITNTQLEIEALKKVAPKQDPAVDKLVKTIAKECSKAIAFYRKAETVLFRGISKSAGDAFVGRSWENREPKDSSAELQKYYDMILKKNGFKALRSNSIFTTSDINQASNYGDLYIIFPKNGSAFHWNRNVDDLVLNEREQIFDMTKIEVITIAVEKWYENKTGKMLNWIYEDPYEAAYNPTGFIKALAKLKYPKAASITLEKLFDYEGIKDEIDPVKNDFLGALESGHEVMIAGEYYAISESSDLADYVLKALRIEAENRYF